MLVEVTDIANLKSGVEKDKEKEGDGFDYSSVKMLLLIMSGLEENPGPASVTTSFVDQKDVEDWEMSEIEEEMLVLQNKRKSVQCVVLVN